MTRLLTVLTLLLAIAGTIIAQPTGGVAGEVAAPEARGGELPPLSQDDDDDEDHSGHGGGGDEDDAAEEATEEAEEATEEAQEAAEDRVPVTGTIPAGSEVIRMIDDDFFSPSTLTVDIGDQVTFVNEHDDPHTATGSGFDTGVIAPGETVTVTMDEAGVFAFTCEFHPEMVGSISVRNEDGVVPSPTAAPEPSADAVQVEIVNFAFSPAVVEVSAGTMVTWTNNDSAPHTVTALDGSFDSGILDPGATFSFTFEEAGEIAYQCDLHPAMQGSVSVGPGNGSTDEQPSDEEPAAQEGDTGADAATGGLAGPFTPALSAGSCAEPGEAVAELSEAVLPEETTGDAVPVAVSETAIDLSLDDLLAEPHVLRVTAGDGTVVACGAVGGPVVAGELVIGLAATGDGHDGVAVLAESRSGAVVTVYLPVATPATDGTPAATPVTEDADGAEVTPVAGEELVVSIVDFAFDPPSLEVAAGTTVTWVNDGEAPHTVTAEDWSFDSGIMDPGASYSVTFDEAGEIGYRCDLHPDMVATISVT